MGSLSIYFLQFVDKLPSAFFANHCYRNSFFGLPHWYEYLTVVHDQYGGCVVSFGSGGFTLESVLAIGIAVIEILLRVAGFVAVIAIIFTGIRYMTAQGNPEKAASARKGLYNAIAGLLIALVGAGLVSFIGNRLD
jgi:hypothetical protein